MTESNAKAQRLYATTATAGQRPKPARPASNPRPKTSQMKTPYTHAAMASAPWSTTSPRGEPAPVRRACFPSMPSIVWYTNRHAAHVAYTQEGAPPSRSGLWTSSSAYAMTAWRRPTRVMRFGATQRGTNHSTAKVQNRWRKSDSSRVSRGEVYV